MIRATVKEKCVALGLHTGTHPENLAALRLHQWGHRPKPQHRVGRYRLDFAWPEHKIALEVDGPHHHRPDVAHKDALRDAALRANGWIVLRVNTGPTFEDQLARVSELAHLIGGAR